MTFSPTRILQTVAFLDLFAAGLIVPQLPPHARVLGCNHLLIGIMGALYSGFQLLSEPIARSSSNTRGRKTVLLLAISLCGIAYVLLGITSYIVLFLGLRAFLGVFKHTHILTAALLAPNYENDQELSLIQARLKLNTLSGTGMCVAPIIGGHIMEIFPEYGFTVIAFTVGAIFAVNSGLIRRLPEEERNRKDKVKPKEVESLTAPLLVNSVRKSLKKAIEDVFTIDWSNLGEDFLLRLIQTLCMGVYFCNFAVFLRFKHQATSVNLGYIISFLWTVAAFFPYFINYINNLYKDDKDYSARNYHVFLTITLSLIGMVLAPSISYYAICLVTLGVSSTMGRTVGLELILTKTDSSQKGAVVGAASSIKNVCGVIAPLIAGVVGHYVGILYVIYVCISLAAIGTYRSYKALPEFVVKNKSE